jgi:HAD superfamily hydrolase (TIGR01509 family)
VTEPVHARAVLLDALGTLLELDPPGPRLAAALREDHGIELSPTEATRAFGKEIAYYRAHHLEGRDDASLAVLRGRCAEVLHRALPSRAARALTVGQLRVAMEGALRFRAYADALETLALLRAQGCTLVVVSNWDVSLPAVLAATGVAGKVDGVLTSAHAGTAKPDPAIFRAALALVGVTAEQAVHVGDSPEQDVEGALGAGVAAVLLRRAGPPAAVVRGAVGGVPIISTLAELPPLL